jgi:hypothetical protein
MSIEIEGVKFLSCPICGREPRIKKSWYTQHQIHVYGTNCCSRDLANSFYMFKTLEELANTWNIRAGNGKVCKIIYDFLFVSFNVDGVIWTNSLEDKHLIAYHKKHYEDLGYKIEIVNNMVEV